MAETVAEMTLAEAMAYMRAEPWACACVGGEWCCGRAIRQATALHRAAHITIKLVAETLTPES